jgi:hypothetical protein
MTDADVDALIQNFLSGPNYQYYVINPSFFSERYKEWWEDRARGQRPGAVLTCLLMHICACSTQFPDVDLRRTLKAELGENIVNLSKRYHLAARSLSSLISPGKGGLMHVQQLILTASWLKTDAQSIES